METPISMPLKPPRGSHGIKLIIVCALVLLMAIPAMFISFVSFERSNRADEVTREVSQRYGGPQYVMGPTLVVPYHVTNAKGEISETGDYVIFPEQGSANFGDIATTIRKRSLFKVPTYVANGKMSAEFAPLDKKALSKNRHMDWDQAQFVIGISDGRGLKEDIYLTSASGKTLMFEPARYAERPHIRKAVYTATEDVVAEAAYNAVVYAKEARNLGRFIDQGNLTYLSVPASKFLQDGKALSLSANLTLGGATRLGVYPFGKSTQVSLSSDWPAPGFQGAFAPLDREISDAGFKADWSVPYLARGIMAEGKAHNLNFYRNGENVISVQFVAEVNPYQTVNRALKYAVMFIGLVFIAFFLFEVLIGKPVHPAQYILIGLAQSIFYLLLLAFSEHIGFGAAFAISSFATVGLTSAYAGWTFGGRAYAIRAGIVFALTYGLLYSLMRMQDFALMIGALASFMAIAAVMYLTRHMDWYGARGKAA